MTREEIIQGLKKYLSFESFGIGGQKLINNAIIELEKKSENLSRRDEIASRTLSGILSSQTEMRANGADNSMDGYKYNAVNEAVYLTDILIAELDKGMEVDNG